MKKLDSFYANFEFKLEDMWIGAYWRRMGNSYNLWICFIPCVPLHISWWYKSPEQ